MPHSSEPSLVEMTSLSAPIVKAEPLTHGEAPLPREQLSPREQECLQGLAWGLGNEGIARSLGIRQPTVAMHLSNARRKLGALTREQAIALAVHRGLIGI